MAYFLTWGDWRNPWKTSR